MKKFLSPEDRVICSGLSYLDFLADLRHSTSITFKTPEEREKPYIFSWIISNLGLKYVANTRSDSATLIMQIPQQNYPASPYICANGNYYTPKFIITNEQLYSVLSSIKADTMDELSFSTHTNTSGNVWIAITFKAGN